VWLPLSARGHEIGFVTLMRPASQAFTDAELALLRLLADELGVAIQNARDYREKLEQAIRDPLTGLYNRRFLFEALEKEVHRTDRYGSPASLVIVDVDNFKQVNDRFGHATGDDVLRRIGEIAIGVIRPVDSFARIGGEEFALLLPETEQLEALLVANRLRIAVSQEQILPGSRVTLSGGVASCPLDARTREELLRKADTALYWAKHNGKNLCALAAEACSLDGQPTGSDVALQLYGLSAMIDSEYLNDSDHSENVAEYAVALGRRFGLDRERVMRLRRAALLHDIGKVAVDGSILSKAGRLAHDEFAQIKRHPEMGAQILAKACLEQEALWVRHHHERVDGRGYPDGLSGSAIPLESRILFVADAFEAMTSDRAYAARKSIPDALAELRGHAGSQFDPEVVEQLAGLVDEVPPAEDTPGRMFDEVAR
jgi:diguanylate cyclase (GGDEF)-like protein/putative nucleotidyltransferase with HDIG domain